METTRSIREAIRPNDWAVSIDLKDAYLHVPIHPNSRRYMRFSFGGVIYQFRVLPFGISTAPFLFTKLMAVVASAIRRQGTAVLQYFDDWLLHQLQKSVLLNNLVGAWEIIQSLGLIPNKEIGTGTISDFFLRRDVLPNSPRAGFGTTRQSRGAASDRKIDTTHAPIIRKSLPAPSRGSRSGSGSHSLGSSPHETDPAISTLPLAASQGSHGSLNSSSSSSSSTPSVVVGQRQDFGRGAYITPGSGSDSDHGRLILGLGRPSRAAGPNDQGQLVSRPSCLHINNFELLAVFLALKRFHHNVANRSVMVATDNSTVVAYIRKQGGTHSLSLCALTRDLLLWCSQAQIFLRAKHIPGSQNLLADYLSRTGKATLTEWSLEPSVAYSCIHLWGPPRWIYLQQN